MDKTYQPEQIEQALYKKWEDSGEFAPNGKGESFCTMLPPPNVTGSLHMGHGFEHTLIDVLTRTHRMMGHNTLWQGGTDHASIATQMIVEKQLARDGKTRHDLGRDAFLKKTWEWKEESGGNITRQMRRLGTSMDWSRERFTLDDGLSDAVRHAFVKLHEDGLIYRGTRLVNWDPTLHTAVSDLEVVNQTRQGSMWHIRYPIENSNEHLVVATTRPETLLGDEAVAVHPNDQRYAHLIGQRVQLPLCSRTIPIIADDYVDPEFGTGCVKITPAHDFNDYQVGLRHKLPLTNILNEDATLNNNAPKAYQGLERFAARKQVVDDLKAHDLLDKVNPHTLNVPTNDRGGEVLEPYLMDQWYVKTEGMAKEALSAVQSGAIHMQPESAKNTYFEWMNNITDWCISRQLWWGHRIPAWYDNNGNVYVGESENDVRAKHNLGNIPLRQDEDVLDTWFSAGLWPFSTLGWPEQTPELDTFYSTDVLITGFDLIFFWVARMIMFGLYFTKKVPFKTVYFHGLIRDRHGDKMSKTKGNVLDPVDLIDGIALKPLIKKRTHGMMLNAHVDAITQDTQSEFPDGINAYGVDALRFTYCALASTSRDICFDMQRLEGYRNFCNKLWNATRFVLMQTEDFKLEGTPKNLALPEQWILAELNTTLATVHKALKDYRFDRMAQAIYDFSWNTFCGWYVEISKTRLQGDISSDDQYAVQHTLLFVLDQILRVAHPVIPFITDTLWQDIKAPLDLNGESIMLAPYPEVQTDWENKTAQIQFSWLQDVVTALRTVRSEMQIKPSQGVNLVVLKANDADKAAFKALGNLIKSLARVEAISFDKNVGGATATAVVGNMECHIPLEGLIDMGAEKARLEKEVDRLTSEVKRFEGKLSNPNFVDRAPADVVDKEKQKLLRAKEALATLQAQLNNI